MAYNPISQAPIQYSKADGTPANGYYLKFYVANSTTPISMQTDSGGATSLAKCKLNELGFPISNPNDENTVFIPHLLDTYTAYRFVLYASAADADSNTTTNNLPNLQSVKVNQAKADVDDLRADLAANNGSSLVGFLQSGTGAVARTVQDKSREFVSVKDFGAVGDGIADDTLAIQAAIDFAEIRAGTYGPTTVRCGAGRYKITNTITITKDIQFIGDGGDSTIFELTVNTAKEAFRIEPASGGYIWFAGLSGFRVNCKAGAVAGDGIVMRATAPSAISQTKLSDLQVRDFRNGIQIVGIVSNEVYINTLENIKIVGAGLSGSGANDVVCGLYISGAPYNTFRNIEITNIGNAGRAVYCSGPSNHFEQITTDGVSYIDCAWGVIDHWTVETIQATTPLSGAVLSVVRLAALRGVTLIEVMNSKCNYGISVGPGSQGMVIQDVTIEQSGGNRPNYALSIPVASAGTVINWKGGGAFKVEDYTYGDYVRNWRFINSSDITNSEVGVKEVAAGGKPTPILGLRGQLVLEKAGAGVADTLYVCRKNASEVYEWFALT